jgi:thiol-disulfide isomerase/thioredoxin
MKNGIFYIFFLLIISLIIWPSCQKVDNPLIVDQGPNNFPAQLDTFFISNSDSISEKQVLLEEFTGHRCVNCPEAAKLAHELAEELDHKLIIYTIHAGNLAEVQNNNVFNTDLRSSVGNQLYDHFNTFFAVPLALINRNPFNGLRLIFKDNWAAAVNEELQKPAQVKMKLSNAFYPNFNVVLVDIESEFLAPADDRFKLAVIIVEDSIVSPQLNNNPDIGPDTLFNYNHRNVLRDAVNSTYGEFIGNDGYVTQGEIYQNQYIYTISEDWVSKNCRIIAYVGKWDEGLNLIDVVQVIEVGIKIEE